YGAWVRLPKNVPSGAVFARMDDRHEHRGWDLWLENRRVGAHIIHSWPGDAIKVVCENRFRTDLWNHLFITYDGSGRAAGVKVFINGVQQETKVEADRLKGSIRTTVPLKVAQRHSKSRLDGVLVQDLRVYDRALSNLEVERLARGTRAAWLAAVPAGKRTAAEKDELFNAWLLAMDRPYGILAAKLGVLRQEEAAIKARGTVAHVMQERPREPMVYVLFRGDYDKRRDPV